MQKIFQWIKSHKILTIIIVLVFFGIIGASSGDKSTVSENRASESTQKEVTNEPEQPATPDLQVSVKTILDDFENNAVGAKAKYENQLIEVSGVTGSVNEDVFGSPYVMVHDSSDQYQVSGVQCFVKRANEDQLLSLSKNEPILVQGNVSDDFILNVIMKNCEVVE